MTGKCTGQMQVHVQAGQAEVSTDGLLVAEVHTMHSTHERQGMGNRRGCKQEE